MIYKTLGKKDFLGKGFVSVEKVHHDYESSKEYAKRLEVLGFTVIIEALPYNSIYMYGEHLLEQVEEMFENPQGLVQ